MSFSLALKMSLDIYMDLRVCFCLEKEKVLSEVDSEKIRLLLENCMYMVAFRVSRLLNRNKRIKKFNIQELEENS